MFIEYRTDSYIFRPRAILRRFEPGEERPTQVGFPTPPPPVTYIERTIDVTLDCSIESGQRFDMYCIFCRNNHLSESVFRSHPLKDNRGIVVCPILRNYSCPSCNNGGGDRAHTVNYCPKKRAARVNQNSVIDVYHVILALYIGKHRCNDSCREKLGARQDHL